MMNAFSFAPISEVSSAPLQRRLIDEGIAR